MMPCKLGPHTFSELGLRMKNWGKIRKEATVAYFMILLSTICLGRQRTITGLRAENRVGTTLNKDHR
jgi:hypothetical protein